MSTTVNYKGDTIATLSNETKTLTTAGSWLEDDIEIIDIPDGVVITDTVDSHGGVIREITAQNIMTNPPTFGVITTINITEPVATISYDLPTLALSYGTIWVNLDNIVLSEQDWMYCGVMDKATNLDDNTGYSSKVSTYTGTATCIFNSPKIATNDSSLSGYSGSFYSSGTPKVRRFSSFTPTTFKMKLYSASSTYNSGTITIYGRIS